MIKYTYVVTASDVVMDDYGNDVRTPEYVSDEVLKVFDSKEQAFTKALESAREECDMLNSDCIEEVSFGIPEGESSFETMNEVKVCYYYDIDNVTEVVTRRTILPIEV